MQRTEHALEVSHSKLESHDATTESFMTENAKAKSSREEQIEKLEHLTTENEELKSSWDEQNKQLEERRNCKKK